MIKNVLLSTLKGINATVFMYGQTGAGKTYTMLGNNKNMKNCENNEGILSMGLSEIMDEIKIVLCFKKKNYISIHKLYWFKLFQINFFYAIKSIS